MQQAGLTALTLRGRDRATEPACQEQGADDEETEVPEQGVVDLADSRTWWVCSRRWSTAFDEVEHCPSAEDGAQVQQLDAAGVQVAEGLFGWQ